MRNLSLCALLTLLAACAAPGPGHGYYEWVANPRAAVCDSVEWTHRPWSEISHTCGALACTQGRSITKRCEVVSGYTEVEAKRIMTDGESLYAHERRHIVERLQHPTLIGGP